jgi:purine-binding chemotaxis protein CheW
VSKKQFVVFTVNSEEFGINIDRINSIERMMEIFKVPNTPDYIEGLVNLRGKVHTVFNLRKRFGLPCPAFDDNTKIIMINEADSIVGIIVDEVKKIIKADDSEFEDAPKALSNLRDQFLSGTVKTDAGVIMLLDADRVLTVNADKQKQAVQQ